MRAPDQWSRTADPEGEREVKRNRHRQPGDDRIHRVRRCAPTQVTDRG